MSYTILHQYAVEWDLAQRSRIAVGNLWKSYERQGFASQLPLGDWADAIEHCERALYGTVVEVAHDPESEPWLLAVAALVDGTVGLGPATLCFIGLLPPLVNFANPAKVWKYCGLHVGADGHADRRPSEGVRFSLRLRAYAIARVMEPTMKNLESPYRGVYDARKARTLETHPEWGTENAKAPKMHYERDARRYVAKRILRDLWRAAHAPMSFVCLTPAADLTEELPA